MGIELFSFSERPDLLDYSTRRNLFTIWPEFLLHDPVMNQHMWALRTDHAEFQTVAYDSEADEVVGEADTVPVRSGGEPERGGVDWAMRQRFEEGGEPTTLCAVQVMISPKARGRGLSSILLRRMAALAREHGLDALIAPVRPTLKHEYPLIPMERYIAWRRDDGELFDPWLRIHERLGASILAVAPESMTVPGSRAEWEEWTGLQFPEDGDYVVPGALVPVRMRGGRALYVEPNVWMRHPF
jgi:GNAT superfamily N-acetyltransferase